MRLRLLFLTILAILVSGTLAAADDASPDRLLESGHFKRLRSWA